MGFSQYIVIEEHKIMFEINRHINDDYIETYPDLECQEIPSFEAKIKDITVCDAYNYIYYCKNVPYIDNQDEFLIQWLRLTKATYFVISESFYDDNKEDYKDYKVINRRS